MTVLELPTSHHWHPGTPDVATSVQVIDAANLTYRKLDHWTRAGYLHDVPRPAGAGTGIPRYYPYSEIPVAVLMSQLVDGGVQPVMAAFYARQLLEHGQTRIAGITVHLPQQL